MGGVKGGDGKGWEGRWSFDFRSASEKMFIGVLEKMKILKSHPPIINWLGSFGSCY